MLAKEIHTFELSANAYSSIGEFYFENNFGNILCKN